MCVRRGPEGCSGHIWFGSARTQHHCSTARAPLHSLSSDGCLGTRSHHIWASVVWSPYLAVLDMCLLLCVLCGRGETGERRVNASRRCPNISQVLWGVCFLHVVFLIVFFKWWLLWVNTIWLADVTNLLWLPLCVNPPVGPFRVSWAAQKEIWCVSRWFCLTDTTAVLYVISLVCRAFIFCRN